VGASGIVSFTAVCAAQPAIMIHIIAAVSMAAIFFIVLICSSGSPVLSAILFHTVYYNRDKWFFATVFVIIRQQMKRAGVSTPAP
jgi:hypothetical protein